jgi:hypothetical protein
MWVIIRKQNDASCLLRWGPVTGYIRMTLSVLPLAGEDISDLVLFCMWTMRLVLTVVSDGYHAASGGVVTRTVHGTREPTGGVEMWLPTVPDLLRVLRLCSFEFILVKNRPVVNTVTNTRVLLNTVELLFFDTKIIVLE